MKKFSLFTAIILLLLSCSKKNNPGPKSSDKAITKFTFTKANNPSLTEDVEGIITGNEIKVVLHGLAKNNLKPTITYTSKNISSNEEAKDFTNPVIYTLTAEDGSTANYTVKVDSRDIYIAGVTNINSNAFPVYWKNENKVVLPLGSGINGSVAGIVVNGNDVYVAGTTFGTTNNAVYWKNGTLIELAPNSEVLDMKLYNGDVYILGVTRINNVVEYVYWKNGVKTVIANNNMQDTYISFIHINGNDVYAGGYTIENQLTKAAYWKNGNKVVVDNNTSNLTSLILVNNDVYAFGYIQQSTVYWKNGTKNNYPFTINDNISYGTTIGNDIHMVGYYYDASKQRDIAAYWKNGVKTTLSDGTNNAYASFMANIENDIYITGKEVSSFGIFPIYWINGKKFNIDTNGQTRHTVSSIFVKSN